MRKILFLSCLLSLPFTSFAHDFNYNYIEGGWRTDTIGLSNKGKRINGYGGYLSGSWEFTDSVYLFSNLTYTTKSFHTKNPVVTHHEKKTIALPEIGLGLHRSMNDFDLLTEVSYVFSHEKINENDTTTQGNMTLSSHESSTNGVFRLLAGMRAHLLPQMDGWVKAGYMDGGNHYDNHFFGVLGSQFHFNNMWSLIAQVELDHQSTHWNIGARAQF